MDILKDIKEILIKNKDKEHHLNIKVDCYTITVYLDYDPCNKFREDCMIPICYDVIEEIAYISDSEYRDKFKPCDYGIDLHEITLVKEIMEYLESHSEEITELCKGYCLEDREREED